MADTLPGFQNVINPALYGATEQTYAQKCTDYCKSERQAKFLTQAEYDDCINQCGVQWHTNNAKFGYWYYSKNFGTVPIPPGDTPPYIVPGQEGTSNRIGNTPCPPFSIRDPMPSITCNIYNVAQFIFVNIIVIVFLAFALFMLLGGNPATAVNNFSNRTRRNLFGE